MSIKRLKIDDICQFSCIFGHFLRIWEIIVQVNKPGRKNCQVSFFCAKLFVINTLRHKVLAKESLDTLT